MDANHPPLIRAIMDRLGSLNEERAGHLEALREIDKQLADFARQLGVPADQLHPPGLPRLPEGDKRHEGSLPEGVMECLLNAKEPLTRTMLKRMLLEDPRYAPKIKKNENTFYNAVKRYISAGKIVELNGYLYHPERAPLPDGQQDESGRRLPANVTQLFSNENGG